MNETLPHTVAHLFEVRRIGKQFSAFCRSCSYRVNFMTFPLTPLTHARMCRHVDHHSTFEDYVRGNGVPPPDVIADGIES